jgi:hypothetical protein
VGELTGSDFAAYRNVDGWLSRMKALRSGNKTFETIKADGASLQGQPMVAV